MNCQGNPVVSESAEVYGPQLRRKPSFLKPPPLKPKPYALELPRFYSSDDKKPKTKILSEEKGKQETNEKEDSKVRGPMAKKPSKKYSKTEEKKETPPKGPSSLKTIKLGQKNQNQKWQPGTEKRRMMGNPRMKRKQLLSDLGAMKTQVQRSHGMVSSSSNLNKIRYRVNPKQSPRQSAQLNRGKKEGGIQTQPLFLEESLQKNATDAKPCTQQACLLQKQSLTVPNNEERSQIAGDRLLRRRQREGPECNSMGFEEAKYLQLMVGIMRETLKNPRNLDFPQAYIVYQKAKLEKVMIANLQEKYHKNVKAHLILSRLTFYLLAHMILSSIFSNTLIGALRALLDNQLIIMGMLGVAERRHSLSKATIPEGIRRQKKADLAIENRGGHIAKNNNTIRSHLQESLRTTQTQHASLFRSLMTSANSIDSFEYIAFLDKTLKWEVLKMPTYPFLPPCITSHEHYLILDLDETLIHFDPDQNIFHVRPYTELFLQNLSEYYEISIFTAGTKEYADEIINEIDRGGYIKHRLYRNHLTFLGGESVKDLTMLGRSMKKTLLVDNLESNFRMHSENGILIKSWFNNDCDQVLRRLEGLLVRLVKEYGDDLRKGVKANQSLIDREITGRTDKAVKVKYKI